MDVKPMCPYCGETMKIHADEFYNGSFAIGYAYCPACGSYGPTVKAATDEAVKRIRDDVKAAAMRRPLQKPLTRAELEALIESGPEIVTYCEARDGDRTFANIWIAYSVIDVIGIEQKENICFESYGKTWRAWSQRPTDEERAAAPWEEADDADL